MLLEVFNIASALMFSGRIAASQCSVRRHGWGLLGETMEEDINQSNKHWEHVYCYPQCEYIVKAEDLSHTVVAIEGMITN